MIFEVRWRMVSVGFAYEMCRNQEMSKECLKYDMHINKTYTFVYNHVNNWDTTYYQPNFSNVLLYMI